MFFSKQILYTVGLLVVALIIIYLVCNYSSSFKVDMGGKRMSLRDFLFTDFKRRKRRTFKTEDKCRGIVEELFQRPFPSVRPDFLKNPVTGRNLELDMYNKELALAFEYNGIQHYKFTPFFHKSYKDFRRQQLHDAYKKKVCDRMGIRLISIPYTVKNKDLRPWIINEVRNYTR